MRIWERQHGAPRWKLAFQANCFLLVCCLDHYLLACRAMFHIRSVSNVAISDFFVFVSKLNLRGVAFEHPFHIGQPLFGDSAELGVHGGPCLALVEGQAPPDLHCIAGQGSQRLAIGPGGEILCASRSVQVTRAS